MVLVLNNSDSDFDFTSLFEDAPAKEPKGKSVDTSLPDLTDLDGFASKSKAAPVVKTAPASRVSPKATPKAAPKKRSSKDFEPDMDALLITAQSPMIIEGTKAMTEKNFSGKNINMFLEAIRGVELYIKILERNPDNYNKLKDIIDQDVDCAEVEKIAFKLYQNKHKEEPFGDREKLISYEIFRDRLKNAYYKSLIRQTMVGIRNYFHLSGSLDEDKIVASIRTGGENFKADILTIARYVALAIELMKTNNDDLGNGLNGRDMNLFIIKATDLLTFYYDKLGDKKTSEQYIRLNRNHRRYFVIR